MGRDHVAVGWCSRAFVLLALFGAVMVLVGGVSAVSAVAGLVKPVVTKDNDANHDGVFSGTESLPTNVSYPWVITYRLTLTAGTFSHRLTEISDDLTS